MEQGLTDLSDDGIINRMAFQLRYGFSVLAVLVSDVSHAVLPKVSGELFFVKQESMFLKQQEQEEMTGTWIGCSLVVTLV